MFMVTAIWLDWRAEPGGEDQAGVLPGPPGVVAVPLLILLAGAQGSGADGWQRQGRPPTTRS